MHKYIFLAVVIFLNISSLKSQDSYKYIDLGKGTVLFDSLDFYISKVIDERPSKESIGFLQKGVFNKDWPVKFNNKIEDEIFDYLSNLLPPKDGKTPLTLVLHKLWISEKTNYSAEFGFAEVIIELFNSDDLSKSLGMFSSLVETRGVDVTKNHPVRIRMAIFDCIEDYKSIKHLKSVSNSLTFDEGIPDSLKIGFYKDHVSMIYNKSIAYDYQVNISNKRVNKKLLRYILKGYVKSKKKYKDYIYFDGNAILINGVYIGGGPSYYIRNATTGRYIAFIDKYSKEAVGGFGAIGALGSMAASSKIRINVLDMNTGFIKEVNDDYMRDLFSENIELYESYLETSQEIEDVTNAIQQLNDKISLIK